MSGKNSDSNWVILLAGIRLANAAPSKAVCRKKERERERERILSNAERAVH